VFGILVQHTEKLFDLLERYKGKVGVAIVDCQDVLHHLLTFSANCSRTAQGHAYAADSLEAH